MRTIIIGSLLLLCPLVPGMAGTFCDGGTETSERPAVGLTLSGGGARGLAHIGVLHIIDSLGVTIDHISGTSMGSIVGGMYAAGYSAREIEEFALGMNWEAMFARGADISYIHPAWRESYTNFFLEIPIEDRKLRLATGAIEGQQLWNTLNELFFHVYDVLDFSRLPIPFACVATDVETGEAVVMKDGNLVTAVRASMAIPSVFTVVERDGKRLIDGGVVNNFPVMVVRDMGADHTIGVNVSQGLRPAEELKSPIDIIYQMGFYSDARSFHENKAATDLYIEPDLEGYTAASFAATSKIIEQGKRAARNAIEDLIALRTDQKREFAADPFEERSAIRLVIDSIHFEGLVNVRPWFAQNTMGIWPGDTMSASGIIRGINRLFATNYFDRVHYTLQTCEKSHNVLLLIDTKERPFTSLAGSLHFSSFTGAGMIGKLSTNRFFVHNTQASFSALLGESPAVRADLTVFTSDRRRFWFRWETYGKRLKFPLYEDFEVFSEYRRNQLHSNLSFNRVTGSNAYLSWKFTHRYQYLAPTMRSPVHVEGSVSALGAGMRWKYHSLNSNAFPESGQRIEARTTFFFNQRPSLTELTLDGEKTSLEELGIHLENFIQAYISWESYVPIRERITQKTQVQMGYNFLHAQGLLNNFNVGGSLPFLHNQVPFIGLNEYELLSGSVFAGALGYQYGIGRSLVASALANAALFDFSLGEPENISASNLVFGAGVSLGYDGLIGPVELTFAYSPQTGKISGYVNIGWAF